jgi:hypothetical protein
MSAAVVALAVLRLTLRLEIGPEWDSNANRAEVIKDSISSDVPQSSFLLRATALGQLAWKRGDNVLRLGGMIGGKVFFDPAVQDQNTLVGQLSVEDRVRARRWLELGAGLDYYDAGQENACSYFVYSPPQYQPPAIQPLPGYGSPFKLPTSQACNRHRDFRSGSALARLAFLDDPGSFVLLGGYRGFEWKPDPAFDFNAGQLTAIATLRLYAGRDEDHEIDLVASYHLERRFYGGLADINICTAGQPITPDCLITNSNSPRRDWFHEATADFTWVQRVLLNVGYALQVADSNSFDQSLVRHIVTAKIGARLFWQLYLTVKGQILITKYRDPLLLGQKINTQTLISIEDENRNAFIVDLERPIGHSGAAVQARYSLYTNEISSSPVSFLRHVVYLGVSYRLSGPSSRP